MSNALQRYLVVENEDDLTRIVFGILEMLGPTVLSDVLQVPQTLSDEFRIEFHTRPDPRAERVPDVLIEDADTTVLIEVKRSTNFDLDQLRDEHKDLRQYGNEQKQLILITGHESGPTELDDIDLEFLNWCSWEDLSLRVAKCDRSELANTQRHLIELLRSVLEEEGYLPFTGFSDQLLTELPTVWEIFERYHRQIARFHRNVDGLLADRGLQAKNLWRNGISQDFNQFPAELQFASTHVWIAYGEPEFQIKNKHQHYLFVAFCVEDKTAPLVRVGYSMSPKQNPDNRRKIVDNASEIVDFVIEKNAHLLHTDRDFRVVERFDDEDEMTTVLNAADALSEFDRVQIAIEYSSERLVRQDLKRAVADDLVELHGFTYPRLYP